MIDFQPVSIDDKARFDRFLLDGKERGCEFSFANLYIWGRQRAAVLHDHLVIFSQFNRRTVYPYPVGSADKRPVLDAIMEDAKQRGIPCRITGLNQQDMEYMESLYPGKFRYHCDRDSYDYVYRIEDLADLKGRKYQKKRNHINKFRIEHPDYRVVPVCSENMDAVRDMVERWYALRQQEDPQGDYYMERAALKKAMAYYTQLEMDGILIMDGDAVLAVTMGSRLSADTVDVHFEKANADVDGAYTVVNWEFARYIRQKYPRICYLNREDDVGLEGLRKAKLSYYPDHLVEKCWACLLEDGYEY